MQNLNLPKFEYKLLAKNNKLHIFDIIRKKYVFLSPEEWVRQHFIHYLISSGYLRSLISIENQLKLNKRNKRADIVAYDTSGSPFLLVECKAPNVKLGQTTIEQAAQYNQSKRAPYLAVTNGIFHFFFQMNLNTKQLNPVSKLPDCSQN